MLIITGCGRNGNRGRDGSPGKVYIAYSWAVDPFYYQTNDPGIPSNYLYNNHFYRTSPGTYNGRYISWDGSQWTFSYYLTANQGEPGKDGEKGGFPFQNGADGSDGRDGADRYYKLCCYSTGFTLYFNNYLPFSKSTFDAAILNQESSEAMRSGHDLIPREERNRFRGSKIPD
jgi:hypothetical protein